MSLRIKYIFVQERKAMLWLLKSYFCLSHNFRTWFHNTDHLLYYPQLSVFSFHTIFILLYQPLRNGTQTMLTSPYSYNWQMLTTKWMKKRSQKYQSMDSEYVTGQINSRILELLLRRFCGLVFAPSQ